MCVLCMFTSLLGSVCLTWWNSAKTKQVVGITQQIRLAAYVCLVLYLEEGGKCSEAVV